MDRFKDVFKATRDNILPHRHDGAAPSSSNRGSGALAVPEHGQSAPPDPNASTVGIKSGHLGTNPGTDVEDFATTVSPSGQTSPVDVNKPLPGLPSGGIRAVPRAIPRRPLPIRTAEPPPNFSLPIARRQSSLRTHGPTPSSQTQRPIMGGRQSSIGLRRLPSAQSTEHVPLNMSGGRNRDSVARSSLHLPTLVEERSGADATSPLEPSPTPEERGGIWTRVRRAVRPGLRRTAPKDVEPKSRTRSADEYDSHMVDVLDTVDAEVATLNSLTNVQNSLFIPSLGRYVNRRPTYTLTNRPSAMTSSTGPRISVVDAPLQEEDEERPPVRRTPTGNQSMLTINSTLSDSRYAVLPHGKSLAGWSKTDKQELNDHVRHMMHSRRSKFKRSMKGFGKYVRRPLGFCVTLYATLITLFGLAWVLFLIGWINVGGKQLYIINVIDNVLVALFAVVGDGLAPFRAIDTYHMIFIAHYHHLTWKLRKRRSMPKLKDHNDLPTEQPQDQNQDLDGVTDIDVESQRQPETTEVEREDETVVLSPKQQQKLSHHQAKYSTSHTFYKPHETETHYAFPLRLLVAVQVLLDCHSLFQISLGACTWGISYHRRPFALTTVILCCSISCNATAGILILLGDRRTRKKNVLEKMNRQELTQEAIGKIETRWETEGKRSPATPASQDVTTSTDVVRRDDS